MAELWHHFWTESLPHGSVWVVTILLMVIGFAGTILPLLPGPLLIFLAGLWHTWLGEQGMSMMGLVVLGILLAVSFALDYFSGAVGAKWFGGSKWSMWGILVGGIVGLFFPPLGIFLGPLVGAFAFEMIFAKAKIGTATKSTLGTAVGTTVGAVVKGLNSLVMIAWVFVDLFWW